MASNISSAAERRLNRARELPSGYHASTDRSRQNEAFGPSPHAENHQFKESPEARDRREGRVRIRDARRQQLIKAV